MLNLITAKIFLRIDYSDDTNYVIGQQNNSEWKKK